MRAKEKAKELVEKFLKVYCNKKHPEKITYYSAIQCALICVEEIIELRKQDIKDPDLDADQIEGIELNINYYQEVKQEIEKL